MQPEDYINESAHLVLPTKNTLLWWRFPKEDEICSFAKINSEIKMNYFLSFEIDRWGAARLSKSF